MLRMGVLLSVALRVDGSSVDKLPDANQVSERAHYLEELGYSHLWSADAIGRSNVRTPDPISVLAIAAASTTNVELGTSILQVPLRRPVELAHRVSTLHEMTGGRLLFGAGAGSTPGDFEAVGEDFDARFATMRASLDTMRALWRGETVGKATLDASDTALGGPPVLIGTWGGRWIDRAAQEFEGWIGSGRNRTWSDLERAASRFHELGGKRAILASVHLDVDGWAPATSFDCVHLVCTPKEAVRRLKRLEEMGFTDVVLINSGAPHGLADLASRLW